MPHQCLSCGFSFEEGSSALLSGCPECKGTRFFYSATEVSQEERERIQGQAQNDLRKVVADLLQNTAPETAKELEADGDGWAELKPKDLRKIMKQVQQEQKSRGPRIEDEPVNSPARIEAARRAREAILSETEMDDKPDTVTIGETGEYDIDVKGLLEKNPIVVHKDGAYLIHLPSLFGK